MKNKLPKIFIITIGFLIGLVIVFSSSRMYHFKNESEEESESGIFDSFEWWYAQRALPFEMIPRDGFQNAVKYLKKNIIKEQTKNLNGIQSSQWVSIGPVNVGGRMLAIAINPTNTNLVWVGSASGGLWKSTTGGTGINAWSYVNTGFNALSVSAITLDPTNPNIIYIGTGEISMYFRPLIGTAGARASYGMGILKSTNGGNTWSQTGLTWTFPEITAIQRIVINPSNPKTIFAATSEGVYKSTDAGISWTVSNSTLMAMDLVINPNDTTILYSSHGNLNSSPNPGLYKTTNAGASWVQLGNGLPSSDFGRTSLTISPSNPVIIYAGIANASTHRTLGLYKSTNDGFSWSAVNTTNIFGSISPQGWYNNVIAVHPTNQDLLYFGGIDIHKSTNGGGTLTAISTGTVHVDQHAMAFDPLDPNIIYFGCDGGIYKTTNGGSSFINCNSGLITTQFYPGLANAYTDSTRTIGGLQDNGTLKNYGNGIWYQILGADGGWCAIDPTNKDVMYFEVQWMQLFKSTDGGFSSNLATTGLATGTGNCNFLAPFVISPSNPNILYAGCRSVYKTTNGGNSWFASNGNQSLNGTNISTIGVAYSSPDTLITATGTGVFGEAQKFEVFASTNGGQSWVNVTYKLNGTDSLPNRYPTDIEFDPSNSSVAYLTYSGYGTPHLFRTTNAGQTWTNISGTLPDIPHQAICIDPEDGNNIYIGTDLGVFHSSDYGVTWEDFNNGMPPAMVLDVTVSRANGKLRASTFGNGVYERPLVRIPSVKIVRPNGGEVWVAGNSELIQWSQKFSDLVKLEYTTDDGLSWNLIVDSINASNKSYLWSIPQLGTAQAKIRITGKSPSTPSDMSDTTFKILSHADVIPGWNLISVNKLLSDPRVTIIFPTAISSAFTYDQSYQIRDSLLNGAGYWLKFDLPQIIPLPGDSINVDTIDVRTGWNMIGSISSAVDVTKIVEIPAGNVSSNYFGFNNSYFVADTIKPRGGYWIKVKSDGKLVLSSSVAQQKTGENIFSDKYRLNELNIYDAAGNHQTLYFTDDGNNLNIKRYDLPPIPPEGSFDARFASERMLDIIPRDLQSFYERAILMSSSNYPITIRWNIIDNNNRYSLIDGNRSIIPISECGSHQILKPTAHKRASNIVLHVEKKVEAYSRTFRLEQNYPNPFNPVTNIKFTVANPSVTTLKIYDILGKEVATLVNELKQPGEYSVQWNAEGLPSGIYFYKLTAGSFSEIKKMLIVK